MDEDLHEIFKLFDKTLGFLQEVTKNISDLQDKIRNKLERKQLRFTFDYDKTKLFFNERIIINDIKFLLAKGVYAKDAFILVGRNRNLSSELVGWIWLRYREKEEPLLLFARRMTAYILKKQGLTFAKISEILKISRKQAYSMINDIKFRYKSILERIHPKFELENIIQDKEFYELFIPYLAKTTKQRHKIVFENRY